MNRRGVSQTIRASRAAPLPFERPEELLLACRAGDQAAWEQLLLRYGRLVLSIPKNHGLDAECSADVMQSTFAALLTNLDSVREPDRLGSWLAVVARRLTWRMVERSKRERHALVACADPEPWTDWVDGWNRRAWLSAAVRALDAPCRDLLHAMYMDPADPSYDEIALRLGRPRGSLGPTRGRCLDKLRAELDRLDAHA